MTERTRVSYSKGIRDEAKRLGQGLVTVSITFQDGTRLEEQSAATIDECRFAKWIMTMLFCDEVKELPDVQEFIRKQIEGRR